MTDDFANLDAIAQAELVRRRQVAPIELVDAAIARIERLNPQLNAVVIPLFEKARQQALSSDLSDGPFRGVPLLLKDYLCYSAGDRYYEGTRFLRNLDWREPEDSYLAARFRAAGFVFVGKTNLPELAYGVDSAFGRTNNPWDVARSPGGSSSGSGAAVASGMVPVAHANDATGSIRFPAAACGLVGLKPSRGRTSAGAGQLPGLLGYIAEHVVTRTVRDSAAVLDCVAGGLPGDLFAQPAPSVRYQDEVGREPGSLRVGLLLHDVFLGHPLHADVEQAVRKTGLMLQSLGHVVDEAYPPSLDGANGLGEAMRIVSRSALSAKIDVWSSRIGRPVEERDLLSATWQRVLDGRSFSAVQLQWAAARLAAGVMRAPEWWHTYDLLVTPTTLKPAPLWADFDPALEIQIWGLFTAAFSLSGQPAVSLPLHWTPEGLPVGVQCVADYGREDLLIRIASQLERALPWSDRLPAVHA